MRLSLNRKRLYNFPIIFVKSPGRPSDFLLSAPDLTSDRTEAFRDDYLEYSSFPASRREALAPFFPALSIEPGNIRRLVFQRSVRAEQPTVLGVGSLCLPDFFRHVRLEIELRDVRQRIATDNIVAAVLFHHKSNHSKRFQRLADGS